jgi:glycosyltransferase involved in cell wall biosynthesis
MNNHFKIIIPTYNNEKWIRACIKSVKNQDYSDYQCIVVDDLSNDNSVDLIKKETEGCHKFVFIENTEKKYALRNIYEAIELSEPNREDIIVTLDGDDFFFKNKVLSTLNEAYNEKQCWITYGSYAEYPSNTRGKFSQKIPDEIIDANSFRESIWMSSHLRTFKYKLWQEIKKEDLLNPDGSFCDGAWDMAFMFPMLEMAGSNSHYIEDILYIYNRINPLNEDKVNHRKILESESRIRKMNKYGRIDI